MNVFILPLFLLAGLLYNPKNLSQMIFSLNTVSNFTSNHLNIVDKPTIVILSTCDCPTLQNPNPVSDLMHPSGTLNCTVEENFSESDSDSDFLRDLKLNISTVDFLY